MFLEKEWEVNNEGKPACAKDSCHTDIGKSVFLQPIICFRSTLKSILSVSRCWKPHQQGKDTNPDWCSLRGSHRCSPHSHYLRHRSSNLGCSGHCYTWTERWSTSDYSPPHHCCPHSHYLKNKHCQTTPARSHYEAPTASKGKKIVIVIAFLFLQLTHWQRKTNETEHDRWEF